MKLLSVFILLSGSLSWAQNHMGVSAERDYAQLVIEELNQYGEVARFYDVLKIEVRGQKLQHKSFSLKNDIFVMSCSQRIEASQLPSTRCIFSIAKNEDGTSKFTMSNLKGNQFARVQVFGELAAQIEKIIPANANHVHFATVNAYPNFRFMITGGAGQAKSISMIEKKL